MQLPVFPGNYFAQLENQTGLQILVRSQDEEFEDVSDNRLNQRPKIHVENFEHSGYFFVKLSILLIIHIYKTLTSVPSRMWEGGVMPERGKKPRKSGTA